MKFQILNFKFQINPQAVIYLLLTLIIVFGFWFRFAGILNNHSFWTDEAMVSSFSRDIVTGKTSMLKGISTISYEPLQIFLTAVFFKLFGISEFSARLPSVIFGTIGILFAFLVAAKLSNRSGGLLAAFLYAFSQLNLANSTQAKPYATIATFLLIIIYLLLLKKSSRLQVLTSNIIVIILLTLATFIHQIAIMFWNIYLVFLVLSLKKFIKIKYHVPILIIFVISLSIFIFVFQGPQAIIYHLKLIKADTFFLYDNTMYLKNLLFRQYGVFFIPAIIGLILCSKKNSTLIYGIISWIFLLLFMWNFRSYSHNIRYLVPLFGIIFVFFGVFFGRNWFIVLLVIGLLYASGYKIVKKPMAYYTPNSDFYGDVQMADYKTMYSLIKKQVPDYKNMAIFNDVIDAQRWYLPEKTIDAYFMKSENKNPEKHNLGGIIYKTFDQFLKEKEKYSKGILIVEDWESNLPEDIKQYAKKNMKLELRVNSLPQAKNDPWPLEVYSWGMN